MAMIRCERCGRTARVEELGATSGSMWLHCGACGHLWRQPLSGTDPFELILSNRIINAIRAPETCPPRGRPRATRYVAHVGVRYRSALSFEWERGLTENLSRSGLLFRAAAPLAPLTAVDLVLELPGSVAGEPPCRIHCCGEVVRAVTELDGRPALAARVRGYRL